MYSHSILKTIGGNSISHCFTKWALVAGILLLPFLSPFFAGARENRAPTFYTTYGDTFDEYVLDIQELTSGEFVLAGFTTSHSFGADEDFYVLKTDSAGNQIWANNYGTPGLEEAASVRQLLNGDYVIVGDFDDNSGNKGIYLFAVNGNGIEQWSQPFGNFNGSPFDMRVDDDGSILVCGLRQFSTTGYDAFLLKTDATGGETWFRNYGSNGTEYFRSVDMLSSGGYVLTGAQDLTLYILRTNSRGIEEWSTTFDGNGAYFQIYGTAIRELPSGNYLVAGSYRVTAGSDFNGFLLEMTPSGIVNWMESYGGSGQEFIQSLDLAADGGFILGGSTSSIGNGLTDLYMVKTNSSGIQSWERVFGSSGDDTGYEVRQVDNTDIVLVGKIWTASNGSQAAFVRIDSQGNGVVVPSLTLVGLLILLTAFSVGIHGFKRS